MNRLLLISLFILLFVACKEDPPVPGADTKITVECNKDKGEAFLVGEEIVFNILMETSPSVGIMTFNITKNDSVIFTRSDYPGNIVTFEFKYNTSASDLETGEARFSFELIDRDAISKTKELTVLVAVDFPQTITPFAPDPGWDLVNDRAVDGATADETDILQFEQTVGTETSVYYTSLNGAKFYDASDTDINFFNINYSVAELEAAIASIPAVDTIQIAVQGFGSIPLPFPLVVSIRNGQEYVWIDRSNVQGSEVGYRKGGE